MLMEIWGEDEDICWWVIWEVKSMLEMELSGSVGLIGQI